MTCEECRNKLPDYLYEELEEEATAQVRTHLDACQTCNAEFHRLQETRSILAQWPDEDPHLGLTFVDVRQPLVPHLLETFRGWRRVGLAVGFALVALFLLLGVSNTTVSYQEGRFTFNASLLRRPAPTVTLEVLEALHRATLEAAEEMVRASEQRQRLDFARTLNDFARQIEYQRQIDLGLVGRGLEDLHLRTMTRLERTDRMLEELARMASYEQRLWPK
ncbi:MAG: zf-HC2 domain-containing protein [candidate division KSB1 bacterium]|nr:zf-HC2 domain-containing protein [candidate division KSB1 bacterium]